MPAAMRAALPRPVVSLLHRARSVLRGDMDSFLARVSGVIHVGANTGQERWHYAKLGLHVLWIEPIPEVHAALQKNIGDQPRQRALRALVTDSDGAEYTFHIASNNGESSSILELKEHTDIWPNVGYSRAITLQGTTLTSLLQREAIDTQQYQALVIDTQGSELLVLQGSVPLLPGFRYIKTEVPDFESYAGCCQLDEMAAFMARHGYSERTRRAFAERAAGGTYYDILYAR